MFGPWIAAEFEMSIRSAKRFMDRAERWAKYANLAHLTPQVSASVLDEVTEPSTPPEVRDQVEALVISSVARGCITHPL